MNISLIFSPYVSSIALLLLMAVSTGLVGVSIWKRANGAWIRLAGLTIGLTLLANPAIRQEDREAIPDVALLVVDASDSMMLAGRHIAAKQVAEKLTHKLADAPDLELRTIYAGSRTGDDGTSLFRAARNALSDIPPNSRAGTIFVTDGQVHDVPEEGGTGGSGPMHALLIGNRDAYDRRLLIEEVPRFGIVDEPVQIKYSIAESGTRPQSAAAGPVNVSLRLDGQFVTSTATQPGSTGTLSFTLPHGGANVIEVEADGIQGELTLQNNRAISTAIGIRDRLRVLLVSGEPHAGERTWRNLLKADPSVDLVHFTILRPPEKQDGTPINELSLIAFPTRELFSQKLDEFDLIIFDRYQRRGVLPVVYLDNVARYVKEGGAILTAAGPPFASAYSLYRTPLAAVLPARPDGDIIEEPYHPALSELGKRHPITADLPGAGNETPGWGRWFRLISTTPERGDVLMYGPSDRPLMVLDRVGEGRIAQLLSDHIWLWARGFEGGGPQAELLRRLAHWLMKEPDLEEERLSAQAEQNLLSLSRRSTKNTVGDAQIFYPNGQQETVRFKENGPGHFTARIETDILGLYRIEQDGLTAVAALGQANPKEFSDISTTDQRLKEILRQTGGGLFWQNPGKDRLPALRRVRPDRDASGDNWLGLRRNASYILKSIEEVPLFPPVLAVLTVITLLLGIWYKEST